MNSSNKNLLKIGLLALALFWGSVKAAVAQKSPRWEIGLDALSLIDQNELPPYSLFGRFWLNPEGKKKTQLRMRIGFEQFELLDSAFFDGAAEIDQKTSAFFVAGGLQRDLKVFSKGTLYAGGDIGYSRAKENLVWGPSRPGTREGFSKYEESTIRLSGIIGYNHELGKNFAISVESSLQGVYSLQTTDVDYTQLQSPEPEEFVRIVEYERVENWNIQIQPFYQVMLSYKF
ncbi:hypothetical protein D0X99_03465 [Algoriphagus lacus]|mgnify:CR=1 FL=1|uniref:DUF481 domain-containing protein n=1 Tax=Algoriphagus lacus TaxID=2056311 RepID=A0A418PXG6_9BACT|nr:hypothetical protein [Algoriphagus lacus]RIW18753.1 hypothetical protein D0X99_03465 [Algoriphagus lacus]